MKNGVNNVRLQRSFHNIRKVKAFDRRGWESRIGHEVSSCQAQGRGIGPRVFSTLLSWRILNAVSFLFLEGRAAIFCSFLVFFTHPFPGEMWEAIQSGKTSLLEMVEPAYTGCQQMAIFYHYYTIQRPFICSLGERESSALWYDTCHCSVTPH